MKKIIIAIALLLPTMSIGQTTYSTNHPMYGKPDVLYTETYNGTRANYDSIVAAYGLTDESTAFFGSPFSSFNGNAAFPGDIIYYQPLTMGFGVMNEAMRNAYTITPNVLDLVGVKTQTQNDIRYATTSQGAKADAALQPGTAASNITQDATHRFVTDSQKNGWDNKQAALVSGTNIKTVNGSSLLGSGNLTIASTDYYNTVTVSGGAGQAVFYLTSDKTSSGTALYTTVDAVIPIVNDANSNYTYGWSYNAGTKALTVTTRLSSGTYVSLLNLTLLGAPTNVTNGTPVQLIVKGH